MSSPVETELKLRVLPSQIAALRAHPAIAKHALGAWRVARIDSRYFDTIDHRLAAARIALRLRRTSRGWVQTLKSAGTASGALSVRGEWETPVAGPVLSLARLRDTPLSAFGSTRALARRLLPRFTTTFRRETREVRLREGIVVEVAIDLGSVVAGRGKAKVTAPICELEIEVKAVGTPGDDLRVHAELLRFAAQIARDIALLPLAESKAERGYRLLDGGGRKASKVVVPPVTFDTDATCHAMALVEACAQAALANLHALRDALGSEVLDAHAAAHRLATLDPEFVHQARVAARKLRSATRMYADVLGKKRAQRIDGSWRDVGRVLGAVRDWDVFMEQLPDILGRVDAGRLDQDGFSFDGDAKAELAARAHTRLIEARRSLSGDLASPAIGVAAIALARERLRLSDRAGRAVRTVGQVTCTWLAAQEDRVVTLARRIATLDDVARHRLRIEIKRLRYGLDCLPGLFDDAAYIDLLGELQERLGKLTDAVVQRSHLTPLLEEGIAMRARGNYDRWLLQRIRKTLPKIASLAVQLELQDRPWGPVTDPGASKAPHPAIDAAAAV